MQEIKLAIAQHSKLQFIEDLLKEYSLLDNHSHSLQKKLLNFTHLDLELSEDVKYNNRVSMWLDFVTTLYVMFDKEPLLLTEAGGVPSLRHIIGNLFYWGELPTDSDNLDEIPEIEIN